jgi:hypothetical protein
MSESDGDVESPRHAPNGQSGDDEEQFRVLAALIGCILVAEDPEPARDDAGEFRQPAPPSLDAWRTAAKVV